MKYAIEAGIIDIAYVQEQLEMKKREEILARHPYKVSQGKDGKWRTYLPSIEKGRRLVKKTVKKDLEDEIVSYYKVNQTLLNSTFSSVFQNWVNFQKNEVVANTIKKYQSDYQRFFYGTEFEEQNICDITEEDIKAFLTTTVREKHLTKKTLKSLYGYVKATMHSALVNRLIDQDPMRYITAKQFFKWCVEIPKPAEERTVSDDNWDAICNRLKLDHTIKPNYIPPYAIELARLTGMRAGELAALKWDSIRSDYIIIDKSEKYDREKKEYYIDTTKNGKSRVFPLTKEINNLLLEIKKIEMKYGYLCEWVFSDENGRIHGRVISDCIRNKCIQIGISPISIHALRRTVNSKLRCNGVSATVAASLLGHTPEVNEQNYTYDITSLERKRQIIEDIALKR